MGKIDGGIGTYYNKFRISKEQRRDPDYHAVLALPYSCNRCKRMKKKCSKTVPKCDNCFKAETSCEYLKRKKRSYSSSEPNAELKPEINSVFGHSETENDFPTDLGMDIPMTNTNVNPTPDMYKTPSPGFFRRILEPPDESSNYNTAQKDLFLSIIGYSPTILDDGRESIYQVSKSLALKFVEAYFKHNHRSYPFINKSKFISQIESNEYISDEVNTVAQFELYMVMAIGCTTLTRVGLLSKEDNFSKSFSSKSIQFLSRNKSYDDFERLRMLILLCIYSFFEPNGLHSWTLSGTVSRMALSLGLNRQVRGHMDPVEREMRHRLFWSVYNLDRLLSISFGKPLAIDEDDVEIPLPSKLEDEEYGTMKIIQSMIHLRRIEGKIIKKVYSFKAGQKDPETKELIVTNIINDLDRWYEACPIQFKTDKKLFSFYTSNAWYSARYYHCLMLLHRPSFLLPKTSPQRIEILGKVSLQSVIYTNILFNEKLLPLNWITLYRFLTICSSILFCLCNWGVDLIDSKTEIHICAEILEAFSEKWVIAKKCAQVFRTICDNILEISLSADGPEITEMANLFRELMGVASAYYDILDTNLAKLPITTLIDNDFL